MKRPWIYFINPILVVTNGSYRKMKQIGDYTYSAVFTASETATNPDDKAFFATLLSMLEPPVNAFDDVYTLWNAQQGLQKGKTRSLNDLLDDLRSTLIEDWDLAIQGVYRQGTPEYIALLPRHRTPFQTGKQLQRITSVGALSLAIGKDPKLQTLKADIDTFYDQLVAANNAQKGSKSTKNGSSAEVEADRVALCIVMYGVLGLMMNHYKETPEAIGQFFLMELLRDTEQTEFTHALKGGETRLALTHTFTEGETIQIADDGNTGLLAALVATKNSPMPDTAIAIKPGDVITLTPEQLGAKGNRFLMIKNMSATEAGDYVITLL
jgi:hypothetical protein